MRGLPALLLLLGILTLKNNVHAQAFAQNSIGQWVFEQCDEGFIEVNDRLAKTENPRLVAIALDLTLGLFGMHRLYLGTDVKVPVAYTLTFGGGGILWLVDLALLIGTSDIESYKNNPHLFMWIPSKHTAE